MVVAYLLLALAIIAEVVGTLALKMSEGFTKIVPTIFVFVGYLTAFGSLGLGLSCATLSRLLARMNSIVSASALVARPVAKMQPTLFFPTSALLSVRFCLMF